jgi:hypothetical protein
MILITPTLNHQDLAYVPIPDFSRVTGFWEIFWQWLGDFFCNFVNALMIIFSIIHSSSLTFGPETVDRALSLQPSDAPPSGRSLPRVWGDLQTPDAVQKGNCRLRHSQPPSDCSNSQSSDEFHRPSKQSFARLVWGRAKSAMQINNFEFLHPLSSLMIKTFPRQRSDIWELGYVLQSSNDFCDCFT